MVNVSVPFQIAFRVFVALSVGSIVTGCDRNAAELASLKADNERLRAELANLRRKGGGEKDSESAAGKPEQILDVNELWSQRFEEGGFRARQKLSDKALRVTGILDGVSQDSLSIYGVGVARNSLTVSLDKNYAARIQTGLAALEKGVTITVQGKFLFDRYELKDAVVVDKVSGTPLTTKELQEFAPAAPPPAPGTSPSAGTK